MQKTKYNINKDFSNLDFLNLPIKEILIPGENALLAAMYKNTKISKNIIITKKTIEGYKKDKIKIEIFEPKNIPQKAPCLIYLHGGAFIYKNAPPQKKLISHYATNANCKIIVVDYRLAPKYPFPYGVEDSYCALTWVHKNAKKLNINPEKIAIAGDSAGGCLTAAVSQMSRDRSGPKITLQMMIYPCLDNKLNTPSMKTYNDTPVFNSKKAKIMWHLYLKNGDFGMLAYASPAQAKTFENLPPAYIETAEFDCLKDEGINYAEKLKESGIPVELYNTKETAHCFDAVLKSKIVQESLTRRINALKKAFATK